MNVIELKDIVKEYGDFRVIDNLNLTIDEGEIYGLLGPNGAGKSTTINMICNIIKPTSGSINVYNHDIKNEFNMVQKIIGLVPQNIALYQQYTAEENVKLFGELYRRKGTDLKDAVQEALKMTGLTEVAKKQAGKFSGGMLRRLNIACALVHNPKILIMDEPTVGIDPQSRNYILETIRELNKQGTTIIYCSHYMEEVEALCNNISIIDQGMEIIKGTKEQLKQSIGVNKTLEIVGAFNKDIIESLERLSEVMTVSLEESVLKIVINEEKGDLGSIISFITNKGATVRNITYSDVTLETVFLTLTGKKLRD